MIPKGKEKAIGSCKGDRTPLKQEENQELKQQ
jgi:hypothetical protein